MTLKEELNKYIQTFIGKTIWFFNETGIIKGKVTSADEFQLFIQTTMGGFMIPFKGTRQVFYSEEEAIDYLRNNILDLTSIEE